MCVGGTSCHVAYCGYFGDGTNVEDECDDDGDEGVDGRC